MIFINVFYKLNVNKIMFLKFIKEKNQYTRTSKNNKIHNYFRFQTLAILRCDNCDAIFKRSLKKFHRKRSSNSFFHVCNNCDAKKFAQRKGVEKKKIWDLPASAELPVGKF